MRLLTKVGLLATGVTLALGATISGAQAATPPIPFPSPNHAQGSIDTPASRFGCPLGYVCIYPNASWNHNRPSHKYYRYGAYNLRNQFGVHRVFNNQFDSAALNLCAGYNGRNSVNYVAPGEAEDINLTPINSVRLNPDGL